MNPTLPQRDQEEILLLMAAGDAAFAEGDLPSAKSSTLGWSSASTTWTIG